jgi:hypothetical protein
MEVIEPGVEYCHYNHQHHGGIEHTLVSAGPKENIGPTFYDTNVSAILGLPVIWAKWGICGTDEKSRSFTDPLMIRHGWAILGL